MSIEILWDTFAKRRLFIIEPCQLSGHTANRYGSFRHERKEKGGRTGGVIKYGEIYIDYSKLVKL